MYTIDNIISCFYVFSCLCLCLCLCLCMCLCLRLCLWCVGLFAYWYCSSWDDEEPSPRRIASPQVRVQKAAPRVSQRSEPRPQVKMSEKRGAISRWIFGDDNTVSRHLKTSLSSRL